MVQNKGWPAKHMVSSVSRFTASSELFNGEQHVVEQRPPVAVT
jgi:hypothetical protein